MAMKIQKESKIKREYIPVIVLIVLLLILLALLVSVIIYDKKDFNLPEIEEYNFVTNEMVVDTSNSKCDSGEIQQLYDIANKIKFTYDHERIVVGEGINVVTLEKEDLYGYVFNIKFENLNDDLYLVIKNDNPWSKKETVTIKPDQYKKGKYTYQTEYTDDMVTYTMQVYSNKGDCIGEMFRKFTFETPIYNRIGKMDVCTEFPEFEYCKLFINKDVPSMDQFYEALYKYIDKEDIDISESRYLQAVPEKDENGNIIPTTKKPSKPKDDKKDKDDKSNIGLYVGIAGGVIAVVAVVTVVIIKRKRN